MLTRKTIAFSVAVMLASATSAMAATTHRHHHVAVARHHVVRDPGAYASYGEYVRPQNPADSHYYEPDDNGSTWSFYQGYTAH